MSCLSLGRSGKRRVCSRKSWTTTRMRLGCLRRRVRVGVWRTTILCSISVKSANETRFLPHPHICTISSMNGKLKTAVFWSGVVIAQQLAEEMRVSVSISLARIERRARRCENDSHNLKT
eukprot:5482465-Pleurochrysis_carterae.AAC.1